VWISHELWTRRYAGDPDILGTTISIDGISQVVVGVLPAGLVLPQDLAEARRADLWYPITPPPESRTMIERGGSHSYEVVARVRAGRTLEQVRAELLALNERLTSEGVYPVEWRFRTLAVPAKELIVGDLRPALLLLLGAGAVVLLLACANVAHLVIARGLGRRRELATRAALGASRSKLAGLLMTENLLLSSLGALLGGAMGAAGLRLLLRLAPADLPRLDAARVDAPIVLGTAGLAFGAAVVFGLWPSWSLSRRSGSVQGGLHGERATASLGGWWSRWSLVIGQVALALMLVVSGALMLRSLEHLLAIDPGFESRDRTTFRLSLPAATYSDERAIADAFERLVAGLASVPGVESAAAVRRLPLVSELGDYGTYVEGYTPPPGKSTAAEWQSITSGYFATMGIPVLEGRALRPQDDEEAPLALVVNEAFLREFLPNRPALGHRVRIGREGPWTTIVGVVADVRHNSLVGRVRSRWYLSTRQFPVATGFAPSSMTVVVHTRGPSETLIPSLRAAVAALDPSLPMAEVRSLEQVLSGSIAQPRFSTSVLVLLSNLALGLALLGIVSVLGHLVAARLRELAIRLALGASPGQAVGLMVGQGAGAVAVGLALGVTGSLFSSRLLRNLLYGVEPLDKITLALVIPAFAVAALLACYLPSRRAARLDPAPLLRD
jgi:putative ABC transport system permease protein